MGCCIPKKQHISIVTSNKKSSNKASTSFEKSFKRKNIKELDGYLYYFELTKYYLPIPIQDSDKSSSSISDLYLDSPIQTIVNEKKKKKIKASMNKLKNISLLEVNDCQRYF